MINFYNYLCVEDAVVEEDFELIHPHFSHTKTVASEDVGLWTPAVGHGTPEHVSHVGTRNYFHSATTHPRLAQSKKSPTDKCLAVVHFHYHHHCYKFNYSDVLCFNFTLSLTKDVCLIRAT